MRTTILTCDRCGATNEGVKDYQIWKVGVGLTFETIVRSSDIRRSADWCRACCVEFHLLPETDNDTEKNAPRDPEPPTLEDLLREIVREEIAEAQP